MIVIFAAAAAVAMLVVNEALLEEMIGVVQSAVVVPLVVLVELNRPDHFNAGAFLASCMQRTTKFSGVNERRKDYDIV